jgi:HAD superfamily hydrolase (TIGR01549 family)
VCAAAGVNADAALAAHTAAIYRDAYRGARRAVAGAAALLAAVKARARVGIVSNNLFSEQEEKLRFCALDAYVDALIVSEEVGISKPDPAIFSVALDRLHCRAADAVMVGDSWHADIAGARAAGIRAVWFNPGRLAPPQEEVDVPQLHAIEPVSEAMKVIFDAHRD